MDLSSPRPLVRELPYVAMCMSWSSVGDGEARSLENQTALARGRETEYGGGRHPQPTRVSLPS